MTASDPRLDRHLSRLRARGRAAWSTLLWSVPGLAPWAHHATLRTAWVEPITQPLLLISQVQRSGGTLMSRLLDDHPECYAHPYELQWGKSATRMVEWPLIAPGEPAARAFRRLHERWIQTFLRVRGYTKTAGERSPFVFDAALHERLFTTAYDGLPAASQRDVLDAYFTALFHAWLDCQHLYRRPKRFITAFTPGLHMDRPSLQGFRRDYPDGFLVSIVREPVSWYASAQAFERSPPLFTDVDGAVALWLDSTRATLAEQAARPEATIVVLFEDLIRHTEAVMRRVCAATGLAFRDVLLRPTYNGRPVASNSSFDAIRDVDPLAVDRTARVSADAAARIATAAGELYAAVRERFGEPRASTDPAPGRPDTADRLIARHGSRA